MLGGLDAMGSPLVAPPSPRIDGGGRRSGRAVRMPLPVPPRVGRLAGNEPVGREGAVRVARQRHCATIAHPGLTPESRTSNMTLPLRPVLRGWEGVWYGAGRCASAQSGAVAFRWRFPGRFFYALRSLPMEVKQTSRTVMDAQEINRALTRVAHEVI